MLLEIEQWYPGHIAKTEKELKEQLKLMDVVIEVRDARIPLSTSHPQVRLCIFFLLDLDFTWGRLYMFLLAKFSHYLGCFDVWMFIYELNWGLYEERVA